MAVLIIDGVEIEADVEVGLVTVDEDDTKAVKGGLLRDNTIVEVHQSYIIMHIDDESLLIPYHRLYELRYRRKGVDK